MTGLVSTLSHISLDVVHLHPRAGVTPYLVLSHPGVKIQGESLSTDDAASNKHALKEHLKKLSSGRNMFAEFDTGQWL